MAKRALGVHRATAHSYLNSLEFAQKVRNEHGLYYSIKENKPLAQPVSDEASMFLNRIFKQTDEIKQILFEKKDSKQAFERMLFLMAQLDHSMKEEMNIELKKISDEGAKVSNSRFFFEGEKAYEPIYHRGTIKLLSKLYSLIYARYDVKSMIGMKTGEMEP